LRKVGTESALQNLAHRAACGGCLDFQGTKQLSIDVSAQLNWPAVGIHVVISFDDVEMDKSSNELHDTGTQMPMSRGDVELGCVFVSESGTELREMLKIERKKAGFSSRDSLAKATGWGARSITAYENGESPPSADFLVDFAKATQADFGELMRLWLEETGNHDLAAQVEPEGVRDEAAAYIPTKPEQLGELRSRLEVSVMPKEWSLLLQELVFQGGMTVPAACTIADFWDAWSPDPTFLESLQDDPPGR
jgi:transcriptional regulator with XRE-family HTH domain